MAKPRRRLSPCPEVTILVCRSGNVNVGSSIPESYSSLHPCGSSIRTGCHVTSPCLPIEYGNLLPPLPTIRCWARPCDLADGMLVDVIQAEALYVLERWSLYSPVSATCHDKNMPWEAAPPGVRPEPNLQPAATPSHGGSRQTDPRPRKKCCL